MGQQWPPRKKKKVDLCNPGNPSCEDGPGQRRLHKTKPEKPEPQSGTHMNMRELGANPGDVRMQKKNASESLTVTQEQRGAANEKATGKVKMVFKKKK